MTSTQQHNPLLFLLATAASGLLFGLGLTVSDMVNPERVLAFLDVTGNWDPTLLLVMVGALAVTTPVFQLFQKKLVKPLSEIKFYLPTRRDIDFALLMGAIIFGVGWGLVGLCPGPALAGLSTLEPQLLMFVAAMLVGSALQKFVFK
jgi:uncharacterized membrane protein YedE/YeeE